MKINAPLRLLFSLILVFSNTPALSPVLFAQEKSVISPASEPLDLAERLSKIEAVVEAKRKELGIPGLSLAIVKDDRVIFTKGFGVKDVEHNLAVTVDTLFAIGSCTKAFTAMTAMMSVDEKKLSLEDSPRKYLPYFKINEPEIDAKITVRDLLSHRSGLAGTDLAWYAGTLNREEVIRVAGTAKPTAKLGEKFQYQNVMYSAAGEVVGKAQNSTWEETVSKRILQPLGMKTTTLSVRDMQKSPDYSLGYQLMPGSISPRNLPIRDITNIAPAGAINSSAKEMAQWLRLMMGGGVYDGKRLLSDESYKELLTPQIKWAGNAYGLGWSLVDFKGHKLATHSGGIDGFNSLVGFEPDKKLGFVLLTNVSGSTIGLTVMDAVLNGFDEQAKSAPAGPTDLQREAGIYRLDEAGVDIEVSVKDGKLVADVPGQSLYTLENVGGRKYKVADPPLEGFFVTFRPVKGNESQTEAFLQQPQGDYVMPRKGDAAKSSPAVSDDAVKEAIGTYKGQTGAKIDIKEEDGKVSLVVEGQPPYPLTVKERDVLASPSLPDTYSVLLKRDEKGIVNGIVMRQPQGNFEFSRATEEKIGAPEIAADELNKKMIQAAGGEANLRKHRSTSAAFTIDFENQGVTVSGTTYSAAPASASRDMTFFALGKKIATMREYFDGTTGGSESSFAISTPLSQAAIDVARINSDFYEPLEWKTLYSDVRAKGSEKVNGEDCFIVEFKPAKGSPIIQYISKATFLVLRRDTVSPEAGPLSEYLSDYRTVDGVVLPFKVVQTSAAQGRGVIAVKEIKFNVGVPEGVFRAQSSGKQQGQ